MCRSSGFSTSDIYPVFIIFPLKKTLRFSKLRASMRIHAVKGRTNPLALSGFLLPALRIFQRYVAVKTGLDQPSVAHSTTIIPQFN
jgi:hypothetical protein